ncbi:molybdenum cofactor biosynthesis protein MoaE [Oryzifoliimicrobium ureilyticus]|uniref:molybdenum cofactor biosynthesis protein MoaE n=1 Tax=Oryzifoliimicrobium ureilyticus TaxID=3113724 RepID=UPI003076458D
MSISATIRVQTEDFDLSGEMERIRVATSSIGAIVSFTGICRDEGGRLTALELEHYPGMAEAELKKIADLAAERFDLLGLTIIHRTGTIAVSDNIVLVLSAASHRQAAFDGANFVMDFLKTKAPFWKKEHAAADGPGAWVSAKDVDDAALRRWQQP